MIGWLAAVLAGFAVAGLGWWTSPLGRLTRGHVGARSQPAQLRLGAGLSVLAGSLAVASGVSATTVVATLGLVAAVVVIRRAQAGSRAASRRRLAVIELTFAVAGELRAGRRPLEALRLAAGPGETGAELIRHEALRAVADLAEVGPSGAAIAELSGAEALRYLGAALEVADSAGGRVAVVLERLGAALDADEELRQELDAALAGPRASMVMLAALPALGIGLGQAMGADPLHLLLHRPLGWGLLGGGLVLDLLGVMIVRLITRSALRC